MSLPATGFTAFPLATHEVLRCVSFAKLCARDRLVKEAAENWRCYQCRSPFSLALSRSLSLSLGLTRRPPAASCRSSVVLHLVLQARECRRRLPHLHPLRSQLRLPPRETPHGAHRDAYARARRQPLAAGDGYTGGGWLLDILAGARAAPQGGGVAAREEERSGSVKRRWVRRRWVKRR
jgi:hypothetical protein